MSESQKLQRVLAAAGILALLLILAVRLGWAQSAAGATVVIPPHSSWLARCTGLPVEAVDGITIVKATVHPDRVSALLRKGDYRGFLQCYRMGVFQSAPVFACYGPTVLRDRMAADPACSHAIAWTAVSGLPQAARDWIKARSTCCGKSSLGRAWPCSWAKVTVERLDGYGPGVVGSADPCAEYPVDEEKEE